MEETKKNSRWDAKKTQTVVGMGMLTAIVVVLQLFASGIHLGPFSITLTLVPILVGAALYGWKAGAWLGFVFGAVVMFTPDVTAFMAVSIPGTIITVLLKGTLAGLCAGLVYSLLEKRKNKYLVIAAVPVAAIVAPIVNTGVFLLGCSVFFLDTLKVWGEAAGFSNVFVYMIVGMVGLNFLVEFGINFVLSSTISMIITVVKVIQRKSA